MKPKQNYKFDHARMSTTHVLAPGLFRSLKKGDYKKLKLDVVYEYGRGERLEFKAAEPLGVPELRVLQGLIAMAGPAGLLLSPEPTTEAGQQLRLLLETKFDAMQANAMVIKGSYRELAKNIGYNSENSKGLQESTERLWGVSIIAKIGNKHMGFRLLSEYATDTESGKLYVALNPILTAAILGKAQHCRIDLNEVRNLTNDATRLMHQRLCGWIDVGKSGKTTLETLCGYIWLDEASKEAMKKRKQAARRGLKELEALGWTVHEYVKEKFELNRPKIACPTT